MRLESEEENIRDLSPTQIRIPSSLKAKIKAAAKANRNSISAEIVERLESSFAMTDSGAQEKMLQAAMVQIIIAAAKAFDKKGLEWSEIQQNLGEALDELKTGVAK